MTYVQKAGKILPALALLFCVDVLPAKAQEVSDLGQAARPEVADIRARNGLEALAVDERLTRAAASHARDMAAGGFFAHEGSDGSGVGDRARRAGYRYCRVAENIAKGQGSLEEVLKGWMASPGHRRNILDGEVTEFGLVRGPGDLWVMVLGRAGC